MKALRQRDFTDRTDMFPDQPCGIKALAILEAQEILRRDQGICNFVSGNKIPKGFAVIARKQFDPYGMDLVFVLPEQHLLGTEESRVTQSPDLPQGREIQDIPIYLRHAVPMYQNDIQGCIPEIQNGKFYKLKGFRAKIGGYN